MRRYQIAGTALVLAGPFVAHSIHGQEALPPVTSTQQRMYAPSYSSSAYVEESHWKRFCRSFARDTQRNNFWFDSFVPADRASVRSPMAVQVANGWRLQNTIDEHYFEEDTARLTVAGEDKIQNILELTENQPAFRGIFVQRASTPEMTVARIAAVQEAARRHLPVGEELPIMETNRTVRGTPAQYIDDIDEKFRETTPDPRVPPYTRSDSGGGGAGGAGS